jgi:hypothetical protein
MKQLIERITYGVLIAASLVALGLFVVLPRLSLVSAIVYQGF